MSKAKATKREILSSKLHDIYMKEADKQGNTRNQRAYADLPENVKEYDRVLADFIIQREDELVEALKVANSMLAVSTWKYSEDASRFIDGYKVIEQVLSKAEEEI